MSKITRPVKVSANIEDKTSFLMFADPEFNGEYWLRGGVYWPAIPHGQSRCNDGYAVLVGQNVKTGRCFVFEERSFITVDHVLGDDQIIAFEGLSSFFNMAWSSYFADTFFWQQPEDVHHRFLLQVIRSPMIQPQPHFVEVHLSKPEDSITSIWNLMKTGLLAYPEGGGVHTDLQLYQVQIGSPAPAPIRALAACLFGMELYPHRVRRIA